MASAAGVVWPVRVARVRVHELLVDRPHELARGLGRGGLAAGAAATAARTRLGIRNMLRILTPIV